MFFTDGNAVDAYRYMLAVSKVGKIVVKVASETRTSCLALIRIG